MLTSQALDRNSEAQPMSPEQFKKARHKLGYSLTEMAAIIGVTDRAIRRYEDGEREVSGPIQKLMTLLQDCPSAKKFLEEIALGE